MGGGSGGRGYVKGVCEREMDRGWKGEEQG